MQKEIKTDKNGVVSNNPFVVQPFDYVREDLDPGEDIIRTAVVDVCIKTGENEEDFIIAKKIVEVERLNRRKELNKYKSDVGCVNVIKKLARQGINAGDGRFAASGGFTDATKLPQDLADMVELSRQMDPKISATWKAIPEEMKKGMTIEEFAQKFKPDMVDEFVKAHTQQAVQAEEGDKK